MKYKLKQRLTSIFLLALVLFTAAGVSAGAFVEPASAVTASDWRPGHIIDDSVFFNKDAMTVGQIQEFLNAKVPTCNRWHSAYNASNPPPYTCLKEYYENISTKEHNFGKFTGSGAPYIPPGGISAAQIIWNVGQQFRINPQVLIVMLQKEQGLVTDDWPIYVQYQKAMGYACPDTAPCNTAYYGFYNQVYNAARQFTIYAAYPGDFNYPAYTTRFIGYNPSSSCGGSSVYIENQATANLYNYTPYQPNPAAVSAPLGQSVDCGAYGNKNFWLYFNNWFGSTNAGDSQVQLVSDLTVSPSSDILANDATYARFTLRNNTNTPVYVGGLAVAVRRAADGANFDYTLRDVTVPAGGSFTYNEAQMLPAGTYSFEIVNFRSGIGWSSTYPYSLYNTLRRTVSGVVVQPAVTLSSGIGLSTNALVPGKEFNASFQINNPSNTAVNVGTMAIAVRGPQGQNLDLTPDTNVTIPANSTYTYTKVSSLPTVGSYNFFIVNNRPGISWNESTPASASPAIDRSITATVKQNLRVISGITTSPASPVAGQNVTASFQVRNDADTPINVGTLALAARDARGANVDFVPDTNVTIPANSTYTFSKTQAFNSAGQHTFQIVNNTPATGWRAYPHYDTGTLDIKKVDIGANPALNTSLNITPASPVAGQNVTATFTIRNDSELPVAIGDMAVAARDAQGNNVDFPRDNNITIEPHTTYTYSKSQPLIGAGNYNLEIVNFRSGVGWSSSYPASQTSSIVRRTTLGVGSNPAITSSLTLSPAQPAVGQITTATFSVTNSGDVPMNIGNVAVGVRGPQGQNFDYGLDTAVTIAPGATYTYSKQQSFTVAGTYSFEIINFRSGIGWTDTYPASANNTIARRLSPTVKPNPRIMTGLTISPTSPTVGEATTVSFQIRNDASTDVSIGTMAVAVRGPQGQNLDLVPDTNVVIPAGSTYTFSKTQTFNSAGQYYFFISNFRSGIGWSESYPTKDTANTVIALPVTIKP